MSRTMAFLSVIRKIAVEVKLEIRIVRSRIEHCGCEHHLFMHPHRPIYFRVIAARDLADFVCHDSRLHNQTLSLSDRMRSVDDFSAYATVLIRYARQESGISVRFVYHRKLTAPWHSGNVSATSRRKIKPSICRHDTICKNTEAFNPKIGNLSSFTEIIRILQDYKALLQVKINRIVSCNLKPVCYNNDWLFPWQAHFGRPSIRIHRARIVLRRQGNRAANYIVRICNAFWAEFRSYSEIIIAAMKVCKLIVHGKSLHSICVYVEIVTLLNNASKTFIAITEAPHATVMRWSIYPPIKPRCVELKFNMRNAVCIRMCARFREITFKRPCWIEFSLGSNCDGGVRYRPTGLSVCHGDKQMPCMRRSSVGKHASHHQECSSHESDLIHYLGPPQVLSSRSA